MMKNTSVMTSAKRRAVVMRKFHAVLAPNFLLIQASSLPGSSLYSSGAYSSRMSADSMSVPIPFIRERTKTTIPRRKGIFAAAGCFGFFFVLK